MLCLKLDGSTFSYYGGAVGQVKLATQYPLKCNLLKQRDQ